MLLQLTLWLGASVLVQQSGALSFVLPLIDLVCFMLFSIETHVKYFCISFLVYTETHQN